MVGVYNTRVIQLNTLNHLTELYFGDTLTVEGSNLIQFVTDRIVSNSRKDITKQLENLNLNHFDIRELILITRLINPMDKFWIRVNPNETYVNYYLPELDKLFQYKQLISHNTLTATGMNIKYYSIHQGKLGMTKQRLNDNSTDTESEIAVYHLAELMGIRTCPVKRIDKDNTFSEFLYNPYDEEIVHMRYFLNNIDYSKDLYMNIINKLPNIQEQLIQMMVLDYVTAQDDRHLSNFAVSKGELYPLYDNGRSLFWENNNKYIQEAVKNPIGYSTSFGHVGTYYEILTEISNAGIKFGDLVNLNITKEQIYQAYQIAQYKDLDKLQLITQWTFNCIQELIKLDRR